VVIPPGVNKIETNAFKDCVSLKSVNFASAPRDDVVDCEILGSAFSNCTSLEILFIPSNVVKIDRYAFSGCTSLKSVKFESRNVDNPRIINCVIFNEAFKNCTALEILEIPMGVKLSGASVFENCTSLKSADIKSEHTMVYEKLFYGCSSLESASFAKGLDSVGNSAFENCAKLKSFAIPDGVTSLSTKAFYNCALLESVHIPVSVTKIGKDALAECVNLTKIYYNGVIAEWNMIEKNGLRGACTVYCLDGEVKL
jgi:hypothetical protein